MLEFVTQKMLNRKWMIFCLIIGNILIVAVSGCNPMYTDAIQKKALSMAMNNYVLEKNRYPGEVQIDAEIPARASESNVKNFLAARDKAQEIKDNMGLNVVQEVTTYYLPQMDCQTQSKYDGETAKKKLTVGMLEDLENHIKIVSGELYADKVGSDGVIDAIISQKGLVTQKLLIGEILIFDDLLDDKGDPLKIRISGVFENSEEEDLYWVNDPSTYTSEILISEKVFMERFGDFEETRYKTRGVWHLLFDYDQMRGGNAKEILDRSKSYMNFFSQKDSYTIQIAFYDILEEQIETSKKVASTLRVLQVPILVLLAAFIFMVSRQILEIEQNDISILKSRGASKKQILTTYLLQSVIVALIGIVIGVPFSALLCQIFGSANAFLEFVQRRALSLALTLPVLGYAFAAAVLAVAAMIIPAFKFADLTIVETKQKKVRKGNRVWWQRYFLDFVMLAASLYGFYSFYSQKAALAEKVAAGAALDPLLFLSSSLFILGAGLVSLRIIPLMTRLVFWINKKRWQPASYASFLQVIRSSAKQYFIMIFLILTIALGIFNAKAARTINSNEENKISYFNGADIALMEQWNDGELTEGNSSEADADSSSTQMSETTEETATLSADDYTEPDIEKFKTIEGVSHVAKVYLSDQAKVSIQTSDAQTNTQNVLLMGINTKDFGETAWFEDSSLLPTHWYHYLNAISQNTSAILVSSNFKDKMGYQLGDIVVYQTESGHSVRGVIYGFVDYWPGYVHTVTEKNSDGSNNKQDQFLIVAHLRKLQNVDGVLPYQVWMKVSGSTQPVYDFIADKNIKLSYFADTKQELIEMKNDSIIQGTNGILTVGFIVVLILCFVGFLIYWILSIQSRSLQFGIFRAMGMTMKEILQMLILEQAFITLPTILMGSVIGLLASRLYVPLIEIAYAGETEILPLKIVSAGGDIVKMYLVVVLVIAVCMAVLGWIISKIKIAQALKLGED